MENKKAATFYEHLVPYLGEKAAAFIDEHTRDIKFHLKITKPRDTKFGDYRPSYQQKKQQITINGNLDRYSFLITLLHELAHLYVQEKLTKKHLPHGPEWKNTFSQLLRVAVNHDLFPPEAADRIKHFYIEKQLFTQTSRNKIQTALDLSLGKIPAIKLEHIPVEKKVLLDNGMTVVKIKQLRTRCLCRCLDDNRMYYINKYIEVKKEL
jgi:SprT protein